MLDSVGKESGLVYLVKSLALQHDTFGKLELLAFSKDTLNKKALDYCGYTEGKVTHFNTTGITRGTTGDWKPSSCNFSFLSVHLDASPPLGN